MPGDSLLAFRTVESHVNLLLREGEVCPTPQLSRESLASVALLLPRASACALSKRRINRHGEQGLVK